MHIWDSPCARLSNQHLLGEHRELHGLWSVLQRLDAGEERVGYANHPETKRWRAHLPDGHSEEPVSTGVSAERWFNRRRVISRTAP